MSWTLWSRRSCKRTSFPCNFLQDESLLSLSLKKKSPDQHVDLKIQHLVFFKTTQLLSCIREDFLKVWPVGDLQIVMDPSCLRESIPHISPRFLGTWKKIVISAHLRTWRWVFVSASSWSLSAWDIRIPTQSAIHRAVWYTRIQHGRLIRGQTSWCQTHWPWCCNHKLFSCFSFLHRPLRHDVRVFNWK